MSQTSYSLSTQAGIAGGKVFSATVENVISYVNPADEIGFGTWVQKISGQDNGVEKFDSPNSLSIGLAVLDQNQNYIDEATADDSYPINKAVGVCPTGIRWARVDQAVTPEDSVYVRHCNTLSVSTLVMSGAGSGDFVASNSIAITVNGTAITGSPLAYDTSNAVTLAALATLLQATDEILTAVSDGSHTITITSVNAALPVVNLTITGGATQATDTQTETVAGVAGSTQGYLRKDSDSNKATLLTGVKFLNSSDSNNLVQLAINI